MRLIDADALEPDTDYDDGEYWGYSITQVKNAPTISIGRNTAEWIPILYDNVEIFYVCSYCRWSSGATTNYCPNCGSIMKTGEKINIKNA